MYGWGHNRDGKVGDGMTSNTFGYMAQNFMQKADGLYMNGINSAEYYSGMV